MREPNLPDIVAKEWKKEVRMVLGERIDGCIKSLNQWGRMKSFEFKHIVGECCREMEVYVRQDNSQS